MKKVVLISFVILSAAAQMTYAQKQAVIKLTETTLMHEMRATPYPLDKAVVNDRAVSFQWPLRSDMNSQDNNHGYCNIVMLFFENLRILFVSALCHSYQCLKR